MKKLSLLIVMLFASIQFAFAAVNLNTATQAELETLKGVGPAKAKMIIDDRTKNGPFKSVDDLDRVKGFGMKSIEKLRGELSVSGATSVSAPAANKMAAKPAVVPSEKPSKKVKQDAVATPVPATPAAVKK